MTGSASGGMSIALGTLGETYVAMAQAARHLARADAPGHRDRVRRRSTSLPHNGAVITLLAICGLTHKQAYKDIAVVAVVIPILARLIVLVDPGHAVRELLTAAIARHHGVSAPRVPSRITSAMR